MSVFVWKDSYSVRISSIDDQHKKLVQMLNDLALAMKEKKGNDVVGKILDEMVKYTLDHFTYEEKLFKMYDYKDTENHTEIHAKFVKKVSDLHDDFEKGKILLSLEVMNFLKEWLLNHIMVTDKEYSDFLISKGVK